MRHIERRKIYKEDRGTASNSDSKSGYPTFCLWDKRDTSIVATAFILGWSVVWQQINVEEERLAFTSFQTCCKSVLVVYQDLTVTFLMECSNPVVSKESLIARNFFIVSLGSLKWESRTLSRTILCLDLGWGSHTLWSKYHWIFAIMWTVRGISSGILSFLQSHRICFRITEETHETNLRWKTRKDRVIAETLYALWSPLLCSYSSWKVWPYYNRKLN